MANRKQYYSGVIFMYTRGPVIVMELPEQLNHVEAKRFLDELQPLLEVDRSSIVLDCSQIKHMDSAGVEMLLHCLEQAMKRDGDLKLATISPASAVILELMRVDRLFEVFETSEEAMRSFQLSVSLANLRSEPWYSGDFGLPDAKEDKSRTANRVRRSCRDAGLRSGLAGRGAAVFSR